MSMIIWNCRGGCGIETQNHILSLQRAHMPKVFFFLEPFGGQETLSRLGHSLRMEFSLLSDKIWCCWDKSWNMTRQNSCGQAYTIQFRADSIDVFVTVVYASCKIIERRTIWEFLQQEADRSYKNWIVGGDFNAYVSPDEKKGGTFNRRSAKEFLDAINGAGLVEIAHVGDFLS